MPTGTIYIVFDDDAPLPVCRALLDEHHLQIAEVRGTREILCQVSTDSVNPIKTAASLQLSPNINIAEPELASPGKLTGVGLVFDSLFQCQWYLHNTGTLQCSPLNCNR